MTTVASADFRLLSGDPDNQPNAEFVVLSDVSSSGVHVLFEAQPPQDGAAAGIEVAGLYRRNLLADTLSLVGDNGVANTGVIEASISDDGRYIAWSTSPDSSSVNHIYWRDTQTDTTVHVTEGADRRSRRPILSGDGRYVAFISEARNLVEDVSKLPAANRAAIYRYDSETDAIDVISLTSAQAALATGVSAGTAIQASLLDWDFSRDGKFLVFNSDAANVTPDSNGSVWLYRRNLENGAIDIVNRTTGGTIAPANYTRPSISDDGNRVAFVVAFPGVLGTIITDQFPSSFGNEALVKDMTTKDIYWVSRTLDESSLSAEFGATVVRLVISGSGDVVAMTAVSTNLVEDDVFPDEGDNDSFDIYRVELGDDLATMTSHVNRPFDGSAVNLALRSDGFLPSDGAYIAYTTNHADIALGISAPSTLSEEQVVGVGDFSGLGGTTTTTMSVSTTTMPQEDLCGDATGDGVINASDALATLLTAVGLRTCPLSRCDANGDGAIRASDALTILRKAVGLSAELRCDAV